MGTHRQGRRTQTSLLVASVVPLVPAWRVDRAFEYLVPDEIAGTISTGSLVRVPFGHRKVRGIVVSVGEQVPERELESVLKAIVDVPLAPHPLGALLEWVAERYTTPRGRVFDRIVPQRVKVRVGEPPRLRALEQESLLRSYTGGDPLLAAASSGTPGAWCLQVLPGADRAALFAELIGVSSSAAPGAAIVCVPEVRFGSSVLRGLEERWPEAVRVDSSVGDAERARGWMAGAVGYPLLLGGRSAVLAPAPDLKLIILDEEESRTYKDDRSPRIDARRVALERARLQGAVCVLASTTPSVETGWAATQGHFGWAAPRREAAKAARPLVLTVESPDGGLAPDLHRVVRDVLRSGGKAGLLVPQAGFARALWCASCRRSIRCPSCEAGMTYERDRRSLRCPRCKLRKAAPELCPYCGANDFRYMGAGSERLAEQLARAFPRSTIRRADPETIASSGEHLDFADADIYVTTWMGTKSAIRPEVSVVGILDADVLIRRPDFRASELAYQAFAEMSEWAGSAGAGGRLLIQTTEPRHHAVQAIVRGDYGFFLERELAARRELGYPPYSELIKVRTSGPLAEDLIALAKEAAASSGARILGPIQVRHGSEHSLEILIKAADAGVVASKLRVILPNVPTGSRLRVDVDPR